MNYHHGLARGLAPTVVFGILAGVLVAAQKPVVRYSKPEANRVSRPETGSVTAIVGGLLIDGAECVQRLIDLLVRRRTFLSVTLAVFEKRAGDPGATDLHVQAFKQMVSFVGMARRAGGRIVVGSHSAVPHAERGWAYQRELELLVASGMTEMQAIVAGTSENARFLRIEDRLGTVESGKLADLLLLESNPLKDIRSTRKIFRVMLNGCWVTPVEGSASGQGPG